MILYNGTVFKTSETNRVLKSLPSELVETLARPELDKNLVINACNSLSKKIEVGAYQELITGLIQRKLVNQEQIDVVIRLMKKDSLLYKLRTELGSRGLKVGDLNPPGTTIHKKIRISPLGVLFHIAAGNMEGLPFYSVIEGLLAGNINLIKLPSVDQGLSIQLLHELIKIEPKLADYIYVFDTPSTDVVSLKKMADLADAIIVWGGDLAIEAARKFVPVNKQIITWGHKISFAYLTEKGIRDGEQDLYDLARHIFDTKQLLCSSCQGIYLNTTNQMELKSFGEKFVKILEEVGKTYEQPEIGVQAQITLQLYNQELESFNTDKKIYKASGCSVICSTDSTLENSFMFGNCWVKPLPQMDIIKTLFPYRGYLQTAGLICAEEEREAISNVLLKAGVTKVTYVKEMSSMICGEAHDGEYPLRRYTRVGTMD